MKDPYDREITVVRMSQPFTYMVEIEEVETFSVHINRRGIWHWDVLKDVLLQKAMVGQAPMTDEGALYVSYVNEIRSLINILLGEDWEEG